MAHPDDPVERARHLREEAHDALEMYPPGVPRAEALAQIATVDLLLVVVDELRQAREQDRREARKDRREARRGG
ncbi:hypothetical protein NE857_31590 [Nocardiopsis exhalans]|uniref:Uncharacterized protein n=1 Tax=Nocardiopsis exhalans TaxID=163604 RepID=A0ABY5D9I9_9ACTN|nr:hypothetical protein [Nocardiopsis exhalans]USY19723.1 hypothetical protein NE857_31590 [Nocardiopsis exhalans]